MQQIHHLILCRGEDFDSASRHVQGFFDKTILLNYDDLQVAALGQGSWQAVDQGFWAALDQGIADNHGVVADLVEELKETGFQSADDLSAIENGYQSKVLHIIAHLLDGFIGIDTVLYNMQEDSHWISKDLRTTITQNPTDYWLLAIKAGIKSPGSASLILKD